jgi:apolipoprotein N-acyltransferase
MACVPLLQIASLTGLWGISFAVMLLPSAIAVAFSARAAVVVRSAVAIAIVAIVGAVFLFGAWRMQRTPVGAEPVTVGLAATDVKALLFPETAAQKMEMLSLYAAQVDELARRGAEIVVFPEKLVSDGALADAEFSQAAAIFQNAASRNQVTLVVGLARKGDPLDDNVALVLFPGGNAADEMTYSKHHLVPGFEDHMRPGSDRIGFQRLAVPCGVEICKDMDFPALSRSYSADGVGLMLVPAWDFDADRWLHCRMAVLRGVEGGFSIARAAKQGLLTVSDACGRVIAEERSDAAPFSLLTARVLVTHETTPYARYGDWLPRACVVLFVSLGCLLLIRPRRSVRGSTSDSPVLHATRLPPPDSAV